MEYIILRFDIELTKVNEAKVKKALLTILKPTDVVTCLSKKGKVLQKLLVEDIFNHEPCERHKPFKGSYIEHMEWMEQKTKRGAKQKQCKKCGIWLFKSEY